LEDAFEGVSDGMWKLCGLMGITKAEHKMLMADMITSPTVRPPSLLAVAHAVRCRACS
jgi:hypothetical protein